MRLSSIVLSLSLASFAVACAAPTSDEGSSESAVTKGDRADLANPAAVHCVDLGYTLDEGDCVFPNGSRCEQWAFFRGECAPAPTPPPPPASACTPLAGPAQGPGVGMANPATVYCAQLGHSFDADGMCVFPDGARCEQWAFYRGECGAAHGFCARQGGVASNEVVDHGGWTSEASVCKLPSGATCEEQAFAQTCECK